jgi:zinc-RING finger domain
MTPLAPLLYASFRAVRERAARELPLIRASSKSGSDSEEEPSAAASVEKHVELVSSLLGDRRLVNTARMGVVAGLSKTYDLSPFGGPRDFPLLEDDDSAEGPADQLLCVICRDTLRDKEKKALVPCGHSFCSGCVDRVMASALLSAGYSASSSSSAKCPSCREKIKSTMKIIF